MGTVTVVIPHYNSRETLLEAVASAQAQTIPCEVIVVDDGSTEPVDDVLAQAERMGATVLRKPNGGVSSARNHGIEFAGSDYVLPLDADDRLSPVAAERGRDILDADPQVSVVAWAEERFGDWEGIFPCRYSGVESMLSENVLRNSSMFRRADWEKVGGYPVGVVTGEDWLFWMRILKLGGRVHVLEEPLFYYRGTSTQTTKRLDLIEVVRAQNLVLAENSDLYSREWLVRELIKTRETLAHFRRNYHRIEAAKERVKKAVSKFYK